MTCFSPEDRTALFKALARDARVNALGCCDEIDRQALLCVAESWALLARLEDDRNTQGGTSGF